MGAVFECMGACELAVCEASKLPTPWGFNTLGDDDSFGALSRALVLSSQPHCSKKMCSFIALDHSLLYT